MRGRPTRGGPAPPQEAPITPSRLRPGAALFTHPGGTAALRAADGSLFDVALDAADLAAARAALSTGRPHPVLEAFDRAGHLGARTPWPRERAAVGALLTASVTTGHPDGALPGTRLLDPGALTSALCRAGADPRPLDPADLPEAARDLAALLWIHDGPAPRAWSDPHALPDDGTAWLRVSREGRHALIEPLTAAPGDPTHTHVRARRLAAAGSGHHHLSAYWADPEPVTGQETLDPAEVHLITALAVHDLRAWATDAPVPVADPTPRALPATRRLRVVELDSGAIHDHPILPVPSSAP